MSILATVFVGITALLHVYIFMMESIQWRQPRIWKRFGLASQADADTTAPLAYNQGFYNLFLAVGAVIGLVLFYTPAHEAGFTLAVFTMASIVLAAVVLLSTGRDRLRSAALQGTPALLGLVFLLLAG
ncbi:MAG: putative rane protein [Subtercola sp.]|nr:putative rane protein [Subtercola sp.]